jgi:uncharacterized protein (DUF1778 family)
MTHELRIRVTSEQHHLITEAVNLEQADISAWARSILVQAARVRTAKGNAKARRGEPGG